MMVWSSARLIAERTVSAVEPVSGNPGSRGICAALDNGAQVGYRSRQERGPENRGRGRKCGILDQAGTDAGPSRW